MATTPSPKVLTNAADEVLNAIRNQATQNYKHYVPYAQPNADSIKQIGAIIMDNTALQNEFLNALINRIAIVVVTSKMYENPWKMFKRGILEFGETVEEIFVDLTAVYEYNPKDAETDVFKREIPDVHSSFKMMNYQKFYKVTVQDRDLRRAFLTQQGMDDLVGKIVEQVYSSAQYDEFLTMKYMIAKVISNGQVKMIDADNPATSADTAKALIAKAKALSNNWEFMSTDYNIAGVHNFCKKDSQYVILPATIDALVDVNVLASAFHMDKTEFMGHRVLIDAFAPTDDARLAELFANDASYTALTSDEKTALASVWCLVVDKDWFMIYDNLNEFTEMYNGQGIYWNYFYHQWKTFGISPFANAAVFCDTGSVSTVEVSPATSTLVKDGTGGSVQCTVEVTASGLVDKTVVWSSSDTTKAVVDDRGLVTIKTLANGASVTITATSVADSTKTDTCVISRANS